MGADELTAGKLLFELLDSVVGLFVVRWVAPLLEYMLNSYFI
jgi:hypothetical protein